MPSPAAPPRSGSRRSGSGRSSTPGRWDTSHSSAASSVSSSSVRNPLLAAARAFGSCFAPSLTRPSGDHDFPSPTPTPTASSSTHGSSRGSGSWKSSRGMHSDSQGSAKKMEPGGMRFTIADIQKATKNFSPAMKIGQGGFGTVFKGVLGNGTVVAVKRAKKSMYASNLGAEFQSEVRTLAQIEHLNLVRFLGYLEHEDERIIVIEYVPNGTLREHLDGLRGNGLELAARLDVATDVAHAITYLHMYTDHPIIHRDIKSSNILLTENLRAKVADFGFARLGATEAGVSHVSTQVKGTAGYLDPEYLRTYQLTVKSDVYSFGVLLVELISGRRPIEPKREPKERITPKWAMKKFMDGDGIQTLDPSLSRTPAANLALEKILELSRQCLAPTRQGRPSMRRCAEILWNIRKDYRELLSLDPLSQSSAQIKPLVKEERELIKTLK